MQQLFLYAKFMPTFFWESGSITDSEAKSSEKIMVDNKFGYGILLY